MALVLDLAFVVSPQFVLHQSHFFSRGKFSFCVQSVGSVVMRVLGFVSVRLVPEENLVFKIVQGDFSLVTSFSMGLLVLAWPDWCSAPSCNLWRSSLSYALRFSSNGSNCAPPYRGLHVSLRFPSVKVGVSEFLLSIFPSQFWIPNVVLGPCVLVSYIRYSLLALLEPWSVQFASVGRGVGLASALSFGVSGNFFQFCFASADFLRWPSVRSVVLRLAFPGFAPTFLT